jgi:hypothetical protein
MAQYVPNVKGDSIGSQMTPAEVESQVRCKQQSVFVNDAFREAPAAATDPRSASRRIATICSSVNLPLRIPASDSGGSLSTQNWSEKSGQVKRLEAIRK